MANSNHQRTSPPGSHHQSREFGMNHGDTESALDLFNGRTHRFHQFLLAFGLAGGKGFPDQMGQHLRVGLGEKFMSVGDKFGL